jgi:hypothetical protein
MTQTIKKPTWWNQEDDSAWNRVKEAFRRDWEQTKHDWGGKAPDLKQDVNDTVAQAAGKKPIPPPFQPNFDEMEPAYRFGYDARRHYGKQYTQWNDQLEADLRRDWQAAYANMDWDRYNTGVRRGWDYEGDTERTR